MSALILVRGKVIDSITREPAEGSVVRLLSGETLDMGVIELQPGNTGLDEVVLTAERVDRPIKRQSSMIFHNVFHTARYYSTRIAGGLESINNVKLDFPNIAVSLTLNFNTQLKEKQGALTGSGAQFTGSDF